MKETSWAAFALIVLGACTGGCSFSASASGKAETGGESKLEGDASLETDSGEESGDGARRGSAIRYEKGKLDYEGVINFEYNRAEIRKDTETRETLREFEKFLNANPGVKISVEGHTDCSRPGFNERLGC